MIFWLNKIPVEPARTRVDYIQLPKGDTLLIHFHNCWILPSVPRVLALNEGSQWHNIIYEGSVVLKCIHSCCSERQLDTLTFRTRFIFFPRLCARKINLRWQGALITSWGSSQCQSYCKNFTPSHSVIINKVFLLLSASCLVLTSFCACWTTQLRKICTEAKIITHHICHIQAPELPAVWPTPRSFITITYS